MNTTVEMHLIELWHCIRESEAMRDLPPRWRDQDEEIDLREWAIFHAGQVHIALLDSDRFCWVEVGLHCQLLAGGLLHHGLPMPDSKDWEWIVNRGMS